MKIKIAFLALLSLAATHIASAIGFTFLHTGFAEDAYVYGVFFGEDLNDDGYIAGQLGDIAGEVAYFFAEWSGNSLASSFSVASFDPATIQWSISYQLVPGGVLGDDGGEFTFNIGAGGGYLASGVGGAIYSGGADPADFTPQLAIVTPIREAVPDSGNALTLLSIGLLAIFRYRRLRS